MKSACRKCGCGSWKIALRGAEEDPLVVAPSEIAGSILDAELAEDVSIFTFDISQLCSLEVVRVLNRSKLWEKFLIFHAAEEPLKPSCYNEGWRPSGYQM